MKLPRTTKTKLMSMMLICLSFAIYNCGPNFQNPTATNFHIQGTVTDAQNGAPISGAAVAIAFLNSWNGSQDTNTEGYYSINCSAIYLKGYTVLCAMRHGYKTRNLEIENTSRLQTINIALERETN